MALPTGFLLEERYRIIRRLGGGNFGDVYLAEEEQEEIALRQVALKVIKQDPLAMPGSDGAGLAQEYTAMVAAIEKTPPDVRRHFIQVYAMGESRDIGSYMAMELLQGADTLEKVIKRNNDSGYHPPSATVERYGRQLFAALSALHEAGYVHCDIKPDNLYIQGDTLRVGDFGLTVRTESFLQKRGQAGQIYYMAPEVFGGNISHASDVYSAGLTLYEFWTGTHPFIGARHELERQDGEFLRQMRLRENWAYVPGRQVAATVSQSDILDVVLRKSLQRSLNERYRNAGEALSAMRQPVIPSSPYDAEMAAAKASLASDPRESLERASAALRSAPKDSVQALRAMIAMGEAAMAGGDPAGAMEHYAAALGLDGRENLLMRERDARVDLLMRLIEASRAAGKPSYAAMYERRLKTIK